MTEGEWGGRGLEGVVPRYEMSGMEYDQLCLSMAETLDDLASDEDRAKPFGVALIDPTSPFSNLGRLTEASVFYERFGNTAEVLASTHAGDELDRMVVTFDVTARQPSGVIRMTLGKEQSSFRTLEDVDVYWQQPMEKALAANGLDPERTVDIGVLAVAPGYRGGTSSRPTMNALYHHFYRFARQNGYDKGIAILDDGVLTLLKRLRFDIKALEGLGGQEYLGSPSSTPVVLDLANLENHFRETNSVLALETIVYGQHLPDFRLPVHLG